MNRVILLLLFVYPVIALADPGVALNTHSCMTNTECGESQYCKKAVGDCSSNPGVCVVIPQVCTMDYTPVCACSGKTFSNACAAATRGESVKYLDACKKEGVLKTK